MSDRQILVGLFALMLGLVGGFAGGFYLAPVSAAAKQEKQIADLKKGNADEKAMTARVQAEKSSLQRQLGEAEAKATAQLGQVNRLQVELSNAKSDADRLKAENASLKIIAGDGSAAPKSPEQPTIETFNGFLKKFTPAMEQSMRDLDAAVREPKIRKAVQEINKLTQDELIKQLTQDESNDVLPEELKEFRKLTPGELKQTIKEWAKAYLGVYTVKANVASADLVKSDSIVHPIVGVAVVLVDSSLEDKSGRPPIASRYRWTFSFALSNGKWRAVKIMCKTEKASPELQFKVGREETVQVEEFAEIIERAQKP